MQLSLPFPVEHGTLIQNTPILERYQLVNNLIKNNKINLISFMSDMVLEYFDYPEIELHLKKFIHKIKKEHQVYEPYNQIFYWSMLHEKYDYAQKILKNDFFETYYLYEFLLEQISFNKNTNCEDKIKKFFRIAEKAHSLGFDFFCNVSPDKQLKSKSQTLIHLILTTLCGEQSFSMEEVGFVENTPFYIFIETIPEKYLHSSQCKLEIEKFINEQSQNNKILYKKIYVKINEQRTKNIEIAKIEPKQQDTEQKIKQIKKNIKLGYIKDFSFLNSIGKENIYKVSEQFICYGDTPSHPFSFLSYLQFAIMNNIFYPEMQVQLSKYAKRNFIKHKLLNFNEKYKGPELFSSSASLSELSFLKAKNEIFSLNQHQRFFIDCFVGTHQETKEKILPLLSQHPDIFEIKNTHFHIIHHLAHMTEKQINLFINYSYNKEQEQKEKKSELNCTLNTYSPLYKKNNFYPFYSINVLNEEFQNNIIIIEVKNEISIFEKNFWHYLFQIKEIIHKEKQALDYYNEFHTFLNKTLNFKNNNILGVSFNFVPFIRYIEKCIIEIESGGKQNTSLKPNIENVSSEPCNNLQNSSKKML